MKRQEKMIYDFLSSLARCSQTVNLQLKLFCWKKIASKSPDKAHLQFHSIHMLKFALKSTVMSWGNIHSQRLQTHTNIKSPCCNITTKCGHAYKMWIVFCIFTFKFLFVFSQQHFIKIFFISFAPENKNKSFWICWLLIFVLGIFCLATYWQGKGRWCLMWHLVSLNFFLPLPKIIGYKDSWCITIFVVQNFCNLCICP